MKPQTMLRITAYASVTISILFCYLLSSYTYTEMVRHHQYPPALWGTALVISFIVIAIVSFLAVGHLVAVTNKMIGHWTK